MMNQSIIISNDHSLIQSINQSTNLYCPKHLTYLKSVSLLLQTSFLLIVLAQKTVISRKIPSVTIVAFVVSTVFDLFKPFSLLDRCLASLFAPCVTSKQNPILKCKEDRFLQQGWINAKVKKWMNEYLSINGRMEWSARVNEWINECMNEW